MASVLVVDDDVDSRQIVESYLTKVGHSVRSACDGRDALVQLTTAIPDVVVLDLMMPQMNGVEFLTVIRSYLRWATLPVIVLTAYPHGPQIDVMRQLGAERVFTKATYQLADLHACVSQLRGSDA